MSNRGHDSLDCVVIGYHELPFERYEHFLKGYGEDTEAYRDLKFSFVEIGDRKLDYINLLNHVLELSGRPAGKNRLRSGDIPNLAAAYLVNFMRKKGFSAECINLFEPEREKLSVYLEKDPLVVAITTTFYVVNMPVNEIVEFIRQRNRKVKIVIGGPLVSNHARNYKGEELKATLGDMGADIYVVEGQGELTLAAITACLKDGGNLSDVPNIIYFEGGKMRENPPFPENNSLDEFAIDWQSLSSMNLGETIQTRTARSCAFNCSFCNYPRRAGKLTLASIETIEKELDSIRSLGNVRNLVFIDDTFNVPLPRFKDVCRMMIDKDFRFNWFSYFRCSNSDEEAIDLLAKSGCKGVFLGIESGSPTILKNMNKAATIEKYADGIRMLHERGILTFGSFIVGFPSETDETVQETIDFIKANRPTFYRAQMWYCEPGTPIDAHRIKYKIQGEGFVWSHETMDSLQAMDHIDRMFLTIDESQWLPQWSFDFWIIPYLLGKGIDLDQFKQFMAFANKLLRLEIASVPHHQKRAIQNEHTQNIIDTIKGWSHPA
jgi:radical SAM PhpK family P-methyltransferase